MSDMTNPKVTVYITNYNYGRFLKQAIESILEQTLDSWELLVIDDGSTDQSRTIMEQYADHPRIQLVFQGNHGLNVTNNIALRLARGDYIVRLDADDFLESNALEVMSDILDANPEIGLVFPDYYVVDRNGTMLEVIHRLDFERDVTLLDQPAHGACTMIRREYLVAVGGYDQSYQCQDGYELWIKFTARYRVQSVNRPLFSYRQHGENLTSNEGRILQTRILIKRDFIERQEMPLPSTVAVVPVRDVRLNGESLAYVKVGGRSLLERKVESLLNAPLIQQVVVASEDEGLEDYVADLFPANGRVIFSRRSAESARFNESLLPTLHEVLAAPELSDWNFDAVMTAAIDYPFVGPEVIQDAIHTLAIFNADSLLSVRPDNSLFYQHHGNGMVPILDRDKYTKLEREALYRAAGGVMLSRIEGMRVSQKLLHGRVGHVVISTLAAMAVGSAFELRLAEMVEDAGEPTPVMV